MLFFEVVVGVLGLALVKAGLDDEFADGLEGIFRPVVKVLTDLCQSLSWVGRFHPVTAWLEKRKGE